MSRWMHVLACSTFAAMLPSAARADSVCNKGIRDFTPAERTAMTSALVSATKAFPPPPPGWMLTLTNEQVTTPQRICRDDEARPWETSFTRHYNRVPDQASRDKENAAIAKLAATTQEVQKKKQARLDALMAQLDKVSQQRVALITKGDLVGAGKFDAELERLTKEIDKVNDEGQDKVAAEDANASAVLRDMNFSIGVVINPTWQTPGTGAQNMPLPPGARIAKRWTGGGTTVEALVLFGDWKAGPEGRIFPIPRPGAPMSAVHNLVIRVIADESRLAEVMNAIDFASLAKLVAK